MIHINVQCIVYILTGVICVVLEILILQSQDLEQLLFYVLFVIFFFFVISRV